MLDALNGYTGLYPCGSSIGMVEQSFGVLIDGVECLWIGFLDFCPGPCPRQVTQFDTSSVLDLNVLLHIDGVERLEYALLSFGLCHSLMN